MRLHSLRFKVLKRDGDLLDGIVYLEGFWGWHLRIWSGRSSDYSSRPKCLYRKGELKISNETMSQILVCVRIVPLGLQFSMLGAACNTQFR